MGTKEIQSRNVLLDIMKGIGIFMVLLGHISYHSSAIYLFHMPLFFFLSGAALCYTKHEYSVKRRFKSIMVPYFIFSLISFCYWYFIESRFRPVHYDILFLGKLGTINVKLQQFINLFLAENSIGSFAYNIVLWFLPCLFVSDYIYAQFKKFKFAFLFIVGIVAFYYLLVCKIPCLPWCLNIAIVAVPFIWIGHHVYLYLYNVSKKCKTWFVIVCTMIALIVFAICVKFFEPSTNMLSNSIPPFYQFYGMAILGTMIVFGIAILVEKIPFMGGQIAFLGRNSLIIMCIHEPIKRVMLVLLSKLTFLSVDIFRENICLSILCSIILIIICLPFIWCINNKLSWMIGK